MTFPSKRAKLSSHHSRLVAAANAVIADEPAVLAIIVSFIPVTTASQNGVREKNSKASHAVQTIVSLCRGVPGLGKLLDPANESFWRSMVLSNFDFTVDASKTFNHEIVDDDIVRESLDIMKYETLDEDEFVERKVEEDGDSIWNRAKYVWDRHPARAAIDTWNAQRVVDVSNDAEVDDASDEERDDATPEFMLGKDFRFWPSVDAYFQPAKYQFLSDIQTGKAPSSAWPTHEDAFTLYCDLVLVQKELGSFRDDDLQSWDCIELAVYPCLLGRLDGELKKRRFELLRHCNVLPHFWSDQPSQRWGGFDLPQPQLIVKVKASRSKESSGDDEDNDEDDEDEEEDEGDEEDEDEDDYDQSDFMFPKVHSESTFLRLNRIVYDSFSDWRTVRIRDGDDRPSPEFFIGPTKKSGRWIGFIGPF